MIQCQPCCCSHMRWEHQRDGEGACRVCGGISCARFHKVGEGHPSLLFLSLVLAPVLGLVLWGTWRAAHMPPPAVDPIFSTPHPGEPAHAPRPRP